MAVLYGTVTAPRGQTPPAAVDGSLQGGHVRLYRERVTLAAQTTSDTIVVALPSKGESFLYGVLTTDTSLGTSQVSVGVTGTTNKYKVAGTFTATNTPTLFGQAGSAAAFDKLGADETVFLTIGTAALPASGTLTVDMYYAQT